MINEIRPQEGPQEKFLSTPADIAIYGGAAGGGKTFGILLEGSRNIMNPQFGGVIFRRTTPQIRNEGGLWDESETLYYRLGGVPRESSLEWEFPSGASMKFAHMEYEKNRLDWQGSQIPFIGFDELTHFTEKQFFYMLSRNRSGCGVRPYIRATCNPDPKSWVKRLIAWYLDEDGYAIPERSGVIRYFIRINDKIVWGNSRKELVDQYGVLKTDVKSFTFINSSVYDNQILLKKDPGYLANLKALSKFEREKLLDGCWNAKEGEGKIFQRSWFKVMDAHPRLIKTIRFWDRAATKPSPENPDPDWTVGLKMGIDAEGMIWITDVQRFREGPAEVRKRMKNIAMQERNVTIGLSQDPGQAGKADLQDLVTRLNGFKIETLIEVKDKETRSLPLAAQAEVGNVFLVDGEWVEEFIDEYSTFGSGGKDDQVDAGSGAHTLLTGSRVGRFGKSEDAEEEEVSSFKDNNNDW